MVGHSDVLVMWCCHGDDRVSEMMWRCHGDDRVSEERGWELMWLATVMC